ncbi:MAG: hypothetical protein E7584_03645 [Ruminococcaceae bacterium]|nr:hypothetical protein [Oscillospiraceae bacterium]
MKKTKKWVVFMCVFALCFSLVSCNFFSGNKNKTEETSSNQQVNTPVVGEAKTFITLDINPSVELTVDANGVVASVYGANEDGQILLYGEAEKVIGLSYEEAVKYITKLAADLDYLTVDTEKIRAFVTSVEAKDVAAIEEKLSTSIQSAAQEKGITVSVTDEESLELICDLAALKEKYPDNAKIQALTAGQYRLALSLSERESIGITAAVEYDTKECIERINSAHSKLEAYATDAYLTAKAEAVRIFDEAMGILIDGVYNEFYMKQLLLFLHLDTYYYGAVYQAYKTTARTYRSLDQIVAFGNDMKNFTVPDKTIEDMCNDLGFNEAERAKMKNSEGKVTVASLIAYCENYLEENNVPEDVKAKIQDYIVEARTAAEMAQKAVTVANSADLAALQTQINKIISKVNESKTLAMAAMNDTQRQEYEACIADLNEASANIAKIIAGELTVGEVEALAADAEAKADAMEEKIKADLTEEELAEVEARVAQLKEGAAQATAAFEQRLAAAEAIAKKYIEDARKARINQN